MSAEKCPHCGAEAHDHFNDFWRCGSIYYLEGNHLERTDLCREREAHNKTRAELEETEQVRDSWCEAYTEARDDLEATLNKNQKLREIADDAIKELEELVDNSSLAPAGYVEHLRSQLNSLIK